jgi:hypothetical protein
VATARREQPLLSNFVFIRLSKPQATGVRQKEEGGSVIFDFLEQRGAPLVRNDQITSFFTKYPP